MVQVIIVIMTMPDSLFVEVDCLARQYNQNRSDFISDVMRHYIAESRRMELRERLNEWYRTMAQLNRELAEVGASASELAFALYEEVLARSDGA